MMLAYGETLLFLMRREVGRAHVKQVPVDQGRIAGLCDRFERLTAALNVAPLTWEGDYS